MIPLCPERRIVLLSCNVASVLLSSVVSFAHSRALATVILQSQGTDFIVRIDGRGVFKSLVKGSDDRNNAHALLNSQYNISQLEDKKSITLSEKRSSNTGEAISPCSEGFITFICLV